MGTVNSNNYTMLKQWLVRIEDERIVENASNEVIGVLIGDYEDLLAGFNQAIEERNGYKEMLIEHGIIEKELTPEEQAQQEREELRENMNNMAEMMAIMLEEVKALKEENKTLKTKIIEPNAESEVLENGEQDNGNNGRTKSSPRNSVK